MAQGDLTEYIRFSPKNTTKPEVDSLIEENKFLENHSKTIDYLPIQRKASDNVYKRCNIGAAICLSIAASNQASYPNPFGSRTTTKNKTREHQYSATAVGRRKNIICQKIISANYNVSITPLGKREIENHKFKSADKTISDTKSLTDVQKEQIKQLLKTLLEEIQKEKQNQNHKRILDIIKTIKEATGTIHDVTQIIDWIRLIIGA